MARVGKLEIVVSTCRHTRPSTPSEPHCDPCFLWILGLTILELKHFAGDWQETSSRQQCSEIELSGRESAQPGNGVDVSAGTGAPQSEASTTGAAAGGGGGQGERERTEQEQQHDDEHADPIHLGDYAADSSFGSSVESAVSGMIDSVSLIKPVPVDWTDVSGSSWLDLVSPTSLKWIIHRAALMESRLAHSPLIHLASLTPIERSPRTL